MKLFVSMILAAVLAFGVSLGPAYAGCGKKVTNKGTLKSVDADKKTIVVAAKGEETKLSLTTGTKAIGADKVADMKGKMVKVISEHGKVDSVALLN
ncbi:MAG: hypothetical protein F4X19_02645 [Acidobacteria bacterium]|nr:hypothetical protein [Acidobacteriota bacterium]MYC80977.1 hypothetical protein [Acidobacteriota bacterium]